MSKLSQLIQHRQRNRLNFLVKRDGSGTTTSGEGTIRELARKHFPEATEVPSEPYNVIRKISSNDLEAKYADYVSADLVRRSLRMFKPHKAPGPDGFKPVLFRHLPMAVFRRICLLYTSPSPRD